MSVLEAAARKAIETAASEGDRAWYEAWRQQSIAFVAGRDETGREVAVEVHQYSKCICHGCNFERNVHDIAERQSPMTFAVLFVR